MQNKSLVNKGGAIGIPEDGASRHNARRKVFAALGARRVPIAHLRIAAAAGARALVLAARRVLGPILDKDADGQLLGRAYSEIDEKVFGTTKQVMVDQLLEYLEWFLKWIELFDNL